MRRHHTDCIYCQGIQTDSGRFSTALTTALHLYTDRTHNFWYMSGVKLEYHADSKAPQALMPFATYIHAGAAEATGAAACATAGA